MIQAQKLIPETFQVLIGSRIVELGRTSFNLESRIVSMKTRRVHAESTCLGVTFDYEKQDKTPLPDWLKKAFYDYQSASKQNRQSGEGHEI